MDLKGINETIAALRKNGKQAIEDIEDETQLAASRIEKKAKEYVPGDMGALGQSILAIEETPLLWNITAGGLKAPYAAYVEFGTGGRVKVPAELQKEALKFKGKKQGTFDEGLENIEEWLTRHGGDPDDAEGVLLNIIKYGLWPQPFLYPALIFGRMIYLQRLKRVLNKYGNTKQY